MPTAAPISRSTIHLPTKLRASRAVVVAQRGVRVARRRSAPSARERERGEQLAAAKRRVDPFAGERIEEVCRVADECGAGRPRAARVRCERACREHGRTRAARPRRAVRAVGASRSHCSKKCRAVARSPRARARAGTTIDDVREPTVDRRESDVADVALDVHLAPRRRRRRSLRSARRARCGAARTRLVRASPSRRATTDRSPSAPTTSGASIVRVAAALASTRTPLTRPRASRSTSVTRTPSRTSAPASRAQSSRIGSSIVRRSGEPAVAKGAEAVCRHEVAAQRARRSVRGSTMPGEMCRARRFDGVERAHLAQDSRRLRAQILRARLRAGKGRAVEHEHARAGARERERRRRACGTASDDDDVEPCRVACHAHSMNARA